MIELLISLSPFAYTGLVNNVSTYIL